MELTDPDAGLDSLDLTTDLLTVSVYSLGYLIMMLWAEHELQRTGKTTNFALEYGVILHWFSRHLIHVS